MNTTDKFYIYTIKNDINAVDRMWVSNVDVLDLLRGRGNNGIVAVLRSATNQIALMMGDTVVWVDVAEVSGK